MHFEQFVDCFCWVGQFFEVGDFVDANIESRLGAGCSYGSVNNICPFIFKLEHSLWVVELGHYFRSLTED